MRMFIAFVVFYQGFGLSYLFGENNQREFSEFSMVEPQPYAYQNRLRWPYQRSFPYYPTSQAQWPDWEGENYESRAIKQRQSALYRLIKCLIESNMIDYCGMMMKHMETWFEADRRPPAPVTNGQSMIVFIQMYSETEKSRPSLPSKPETPTHPEMSTTKLPEELKKPDMLFISTTEATSSSQETSTKELVITEVPKLSHVGKESVNQTDLVEPETTTQLGALVFMDNPNDEKSKCR